jgi:putative cell wall-binding protein
VPNHAQGTSQAENIDGARQRRSRSVGRAALVLACVALVGGVPAVVATSQAAAATWSLTRWQGPDRYATAAAIARGAYPAGAGSVVVASGLAFPDALSAAYLAGYVSGPVLLTDPARLPAATSTALTALGATKVYLVGGAAAVSDAVQAQLAALPAAGGGSIVVTRVSGLTRYDTAAVIATLPPASHVGTVGGAKTALLASGANFPDALAGSPIATAASLPILLTDPASLSAQVTETISSLGVTHVVILGGASAVSAAAETALRATGVSVERLAGADRTGTAAAVASWAISNVGFVTTRVAVARGDQAGGGVDALALGALAGVRHEPLLLASSPSDPGAGTATWLRANNGAMTGGDAAGGTSALTDALLAILASPTVAPVVVIPAGAPYLTYSATLAEAGTGTGYNAYINAHDANNNAIAIGIQTDSFSPGSLGKPTYTWERVQNGQFTFAYLGPASNGNEPITLKWWQGVDAAVFYVGSTPIANVPVHLVPRLFFNAEGDARINGDSVHDTFTDVQITVGNSCPTYCGLNGSWNTSSFNFFGLAATNTNGKLQNGANFSVNGTVSGLPPSGDWDNHVVAGIAMIAQMWNGQ